MENIPLNNLTIKESENSKQFILTKDSIPHNILIKKYNNYLLFKSREYQLVSNLDILIKMTNINFETIDGAYNFIIDLFNKNRAFIKDITNNMLKIFLLIYEEEIPINIPFDNLIPDEVNSFINLTYDSFSYYNYDNSFIIFITITNELYLVYATEAKTIKCFNLLDKKPIIEIKDSNENIKYITNFRHFYDEYNKRDLLMSICGIKNNIKVWNVNNWDFIIELKDIYKTGNIFSACFINDNENKNIYLIASNCTLFKSSQCLKIFDLKGNYLKEIKKSNEKTYFIDIYYDIKQNTNYIVTVNKENIKAYIYEKNEMYKTYQEKKEKTPKLIIDDYHYNYVINDFESILQLIECCDDGYIRIWDFHMANLIKKINVNKNCIYSLCLWNNKYLFGASEDKTIKLIDLKDGLLIKELGFNCDQLCTIKKIIHPDYGECLISQGYKKEQIKLWYNKNL